MSENYLEKYREALRDGDEEKANEYYRKYRGQETDEDSEEEQENNDEEPKMVDPSEFTVSEAKDYADELDDVEAFLEAEREGKDRTTLVEYLKNRVE